MKLFRLLFAIILMVAYFSLVQPALADRPDFRKNKDYLEITEKITSLSSLTAPTPEVAQEIDDLKFLQYSIESGAIGGQCINSTGKTLGIYVSEPEHNSRQVSTGQLYFLANGQSTDLSLDCDGFYLPKDSLATLIDNGGKAQELIGPKAIKIMDGTRLIISSDPSTGKLEFNSPFIQVLAKEESDWFIPQVTQALVDTRIANLPDND